MKRKQLHDGAHLSLDERKIIQAGKEYLRDLGDFREGINLTTKECDSIAMAIAPLLKQGQSVHQILSAHVLKHCSGYTSHRS